MALGEMAQCSQEERDEAYRTCEYHPTPTESVFGLPRVEWLFRENDKKPFKRVVDLCCNDNAMSRWLANGPHLDYLLGVDINEPAIEGANKFKETLTFPELVEYRCQSVFELEEEGEFDTAIAFECIEHFLEPEARALIQAAWKLLAPGGTMYWSTPHADGVWGVTNPDKYHVFLLRPEEVEQLFEEEVGIHPEVHVWKDILHWKVTKP